MNTLRKLRERTARAMAAIPAAALLAMALGGCDQVQHQGSLPTYPDSKLETMRSVTGAALPDDPHLDRHTSVTAAAASAPPPAAR